MTKLSGREKTMLYALALFLLAVGGIYFIIMPMASHYATLKSAVDGMEALVAKTNMTINSAVGADDDIARYEEEIASMEGQLAPGMDSVQLDRYVTGMVASLGLTPKTLSVGFARAGDLDEAEEAAELPVSRAEVSVSFGSRDAAEVMRLLQTMQSEPGVAVTAFSYEEAYDLNGEERLNVQIDLAIYMLP